MLSRITALRRAVAALLIVTVGAQPVLAADFQYRIPRDVPSPVSAPTGVGDGVIDTGANPTVPVLVLSPNSLQFDVTNGARATHSSLLTNTSEGSTTLSGITSNADFSVTHDCPATLAAGASCVISATPSATVSAGTRYPLAVMAPGIAAPAVLQLSTFERTAAEPVPRLFLSEDLVSLGTTLKPGEVSSASVTLTNGGTAPATLGGIASSKDFTITSDCPDVLAAGARCTISASFSSYVPNGHSVTLAVTSGVSGDVTPLTFYASVQSDPALRPALAFNTSSLVFDHLDVGASATKTAYLSNRGTAPAVLAPFTSSPNFAVQGNCPETLDIGASCAVSVTFTATVAGTAPAYSLVAQAQDKVSTQLFLQGYVNGSGTSATSAVTFTPDSLAFGGMPVGKASTMQASVTNSGATAVSLKTVAVDNGADVFSQSNDCGNSIAPGAVCTVNVTFKPVKAEQRAGRVALTLADGSQAALPLSGTGQAATLSVGPTIVQFGAVALPGASQTQTVSLGNSGNIPLTGLSLTNQDSRLLVDYGTCTDTLAANQGCVLTLTYAPTTDGPFNSSIQVGSTNGGSALISVTGTAVRLSVAPSSLAFPGTKVGTSAADQTVTLSNNGQQAAALAGISVTVGAGQFGQSNNCGTSLPAGASCSIAVRYTPTSEGTHQGELDISSNKMPVARVSLQGAGVVPKLTLSTTSVAFPQTNVGQTAAAVNFTVSNLTDTATTITGMGLVTGSDQFGQSNNCGTVLSAGASCTVSVQMTPTATGTISGAWSVVSSIGTYTVSLSGQGTQPVASLSDSSTGTGTSTGTDAALTPSNAAVSDGFTHYAITFLDTEVGTSSAVRNVKFSNKGDGPLAIQGISVANGASDFSQSNNCGAALAPGAACTIALLFTPSDLGARTGGLALLSDTGNFYFDLSGKGIGATGRWTLDTSADFGSVAVGSSVQRGFTFQNTGTVAAKNIVTSVSGTDIAFVSNSCGTADVPVTLTAGATCRVTLKYVPTTSGTLTDAALTASGHLVNGPVVQALTGGSPPPALAFGATPTGDFGTVTAGASTSLTFTLQNTGKFTDTLAATPVVSGAGFTRTGGTCASGLSLSANGTCTVIVTVSAASAGNLAGSVTASSTQGANAQIALQAKVVQSSYAISGAAGSNTTPVTDFGVLTAGSGVSPVKYFYLRDDSNIASITTNLVSLVGDSSFAVTGIAVVDYSDAVKVNCTSSATGSTTSCNSGAPSRAVRVGVKFAPASAGSKTVTLHLEHNGAQGASDIQLTGTGVFDATGTWSSSDPSTVALTAANLAYGTQTPGATLSKTFWVRNTGAHGAEAVGFTLSGDTSQFKIVSVYKDYYGFTSAAQCNAGGAVAADKLSAAPCLTDDVATVGSRYPNVQVTVQFAPTAVGAYSVTLTPTTNNGTVLPGAITLTGTGQFNPTGAWSTNSQTTVTPTAANLSYGTKTTGTSMDKVLVVRNVGTNGAEAVGFTLSGDTSQFQIVAVKRAYPNSSTSDNLTCTSGGVIAADKLSAVPCLASDVANTYDYDHVVVTVRFLPTAVGNYSVTLTPTTNNGTVLPAAVSLTGTGQFNPTGAWSTNSQTTVTPTAANLSYGTKTTGTSMDKVLVVRNVGTNGAEAVGFTLSGDTSQFQIVAVKRAYPNSSTSDNLTCTSGGVIAADKLSAVPCLASDVANTYDYNHVVVTVRFLPTAVGNYSITLTPTTNNGTVLPGAITLTGAGQFNPTGAWSTNASSTVAPTVAYVDYGTKTTGTTSDKKLYIRNVGTNGAEAVGFTLSGDTSQFQIVAVQRAYPDSNSSTTACVSGGTIAADKLSAVPCLASDVANTYDYNHAVATVRFVPTVAGRYSVTLTPTTNNGTVVPGGITLTGTAQ
jgi:hypothetical protein